MKPAPLYLDDTAIAARIGVTPSAFRAKVAMLEGRGFPRANAFFDGKRYWPAVRAWLDRQEGVVTNSEIVNDGREQWEAA